MVGGVGVVALLLTAGCGGGGSGDDPVASPGADGGEATTDVPGGADGQGVDRHAELIGRWEIHSYRLPDGALTDALDIAYLEFGADGSLAFGTGCNDGTTGYVAGAGYVTPGTSLDDAPAGQTITIGPALALTERACDGLLGEQDRDLPVALRAAQRFAFEGERLWLLDASLLIEAERAG